MKKAIVATSLLATPLPLVIGGMFLASSLFSWVEVGVLIYAALIVTTLLVSQRPAALKAAVLIANAVVIFDQGGQLLLASADTQWSHGVIISYALLTSAAVLVIPKDVVWSDYLFGPKPSARRNSDTR